MRTYDPFCFSSLFPVEKGWSSDKKYRAVSKSGDSFLLRIMPKNKKTACEDLFLLQKENAARGVPMCEPFAFGECEEGFYQLRRKTPCFSDGDIRR